MGIYAPGAVIVECRTVVKIKKYHDEMQIIVRKIQGHRLKIMIQLFQTIQLLVQKCVKCAVLILVFSKILQGGLRTLNYVGTEVGEAPTSTFSPGGRNARYATAQKSPNEFLELCTTLHFLILSQLRVISSSVSELVTYNDILTGYFNS